MNTFFRSLFIFGACIVLAIFLGFMLAGPLTYTSLLVYALIASILMFPIFLRWHYPMMLLGWNMAAVVLFMPGRPLVCLPLIALSLGISIMQRMISRDSQFVRAPQITMPLLVLLAVIIVTAKLTGFGLRIFGSATYGANKYFYLIGGILGYFALSAKRIPPERVNLYLGLYFLGGLTAVIGDLISLLPHAAWSLYYIFQPNFYAFQNQGPGAEAIRLSGTAAACLFFFWYMMARYGIRGMFLSGRPWRWMIFVLFFIPGLFGGFRGYIVICGLLFAIQFFLEGLHRTKLMGVFTAIGLLVALALVPLSDHLPYTFQRAISFLPYKVSNAARMDAEGSWDWRVNMWNALLPQIPEYLLLGKGYTIDPRDYDFVMGPEAAVHTTFAQNQGLALAEDYHNGPISIVIPFGIWGCIGFLWFIAAGTWAVYRNYRYGDPTLKRVNTFLLAAFVTETIFFLFLFGGFNSDMLKFCGLLGLSVAVNGGVARRMVRVVQTAPQPARPRGFVPATASPAPAFQRRLPGIQ